VEARDRPPRCTRHRRAAGTLDSRADPVPERDSFVGCELDQEFFRDPVRLDPLANDRARSASHAPYRSVAAMELAPPCSDS